MWSTLYACTILMKPAFSWQVSKNPQMSNFIKIRLVGPQLFRAEGRTDGRLDGQTILWTCLKMLPNYKLYLLPAYIPHIWTLLLIFMKLLCENYAAGLLVLPASSNYNVTHEQFCETKVNKSNINLDVWLTVHRNSVWIRKTRQPCAHHQKLTTAWYYSLVLVCAVAAGRLSSLVGR